MADRDAWIRLRGAYEAAWQHRRRTGEAADDVLISALIDAQVDPVWSAPGDGHDLLLRYWREGVEPRRLRRAMLAEVPGMLRTALAPWVEVVRALRDGESVDLTWMEMPDGHKALSRSRHANDLVLRYFHQRVEQTSLEFTRDPGAEETLSRSRMAGSVERSDWNDVPVWLRMKSEPERAEVMVGSLRVGWCELPLAAWASVAQEASRGVYADGILQVRDAPDPDGATVVGILRCWLPRQPDA